MSNGRGFGRGNPRGRGGRGGIGPGGRGSESYVDSRNDWEKLDKISIGTNLRTLKKACVANCRENWKSMMSVMETDKYVVMERPTKAKVIADLNSFATGDFTNVMGLEHVIYDDVHDERIEESDDEYEEESNDGAAGAPVSGAADRAQQNTAESGEVDEDGEAAAGRVAAAGREPAVGGAATRMARTEAHGYSMKQINKLLEAELAEWMKFLRKFKQDKEGAYRDMWAKCNEDVRAVCKTKPEFKKMERLLDFRELYMMLHVVLSGGGFADPDDIREKVEDEWRALKMYSKEVLDVFKERFDIMVTKLTCVEIHKSDEELATAFIRKLDDDRFAELQKVQKRSGDHRGALYKTPKIASLDEAYAIAQSETVARGTPSRSTPQETGNRYGAAFVARGARGGRGRGRGRGGEKTGEAPLTCYKCKGHGHKSDVTSSDTKEVVCWNCDGVGHYSNNCPSEAKKEKAEEKKA
jgi:hypothetical protein